MTHLHDTLVTKNAARKMLGVSTHRFERLVADGVLPGPLDPDSVRPVWSQIELRAYQDQRGRDFAQRGAA